MKETTRNASFHTFLKRGFIPQLKLKLQYKRVCQALMKFFSLMLQLAGIKMLDQSLQMTVMISCI